MYYDMSIDGKYYKSGLDTLESSQFEGFCINKFINQRDINKFTDFNLPFKLRNKKTFKKLSVVLENNSFNTKHLISKCDVLCLKLVDCDKPLDGSCCDIATFDFKKVIKFKNICNDIYYEIDLIDSLYDKKERLTWMYNVRELLRITKCKNVVVGTGASYPTELKAPLDIIKMLSIFNLGEDKCKMILENNARCLEKCAMKRFMSNECVFSDIPEGDLKEEFLIKKIIK